MRIDKHGNQDLGTFDATNLLPRMYAPWTGFGLHSTTSKTATNTKDTYLDDLKSIAIFYGLYPEDVDALLAEGYTTDDIEEILYCG